MIERVMRELGRRIKNIAYGWSDRGVTKIARIILKRFAKCQGVGSLLEEDVRR